MSPEAARQWQAIFRDLVITLLATFMLLYETVFAKEPNAYIIGAGLTLMGAPFAIRLDTWRRKADDAEETANPAPLPRDNDRARRGR